MYFSQQPSFLHPSSSSFRQTMHVSSQVPFQQVIYSNRKLEHINCIFPQTEQSGGLFIGDTISTLKSEYITENNIQAVLCLNAQASKNLQISRHHLDYKYVETQDHIQYPIHLHFASTNEFINSKLKEKKNVLVQCHAGVSRSSTIICAYLIKHKLWRPEQAVNFLKQKRHRTKPNAGFMKQLDQYWYSLNKQKNKSHQIKLKSSLNESKVSVQLSPKKQALLKRQNTVNKIQFTSPAVKSVKSDTSILCPEAQEELKIKNIQHSRKVSIHKDIKEKSQPKMIRSQSRLGNAQNSFQFFGNRKSVQYEQPIQNTTRTQAPKSLTQSLPPQPPAGQHWPQSYIPQFPQQLPSSSHSQFVAQHYPSPHGYHEQFQYQSPQNKHSFQQQYMQPQPQYQPQFHQVYQYQNGNSYQYQFIQPPWQPVPQRISNSYSNGHNSYPSVQVYDRYEYPQDLRMSR